MIFPHKSIFSPALSDKIGENHLTRLKSMRALVIYCHPCEESYNAAVRDKTIQVLKKAGHDVRLLDLYAAGFNPVMAAGERRGYHERKINEMPVSDHITLVKWATMLVFVYPTWWFGLPAMLKGWLDRVWVPHIMFTLPQGKGNIVGNMTHIRKVAVITTCGTSWFVMKFAGEPGRRTIERGLVKLCSSDCRKLFLAHYKMDQSTDTSRARFLAKVEKSLARF